MAMLRNLRNMIEAGLNQNYHNKIISRLTDEVAILIIFYFCLLKIWLTLIWVGFLGVRFEVCVCGGGGG